MFTHTIRAVLFDWDLTLCLVGGTSASANRLWLQLRALGYGYSLAKVQAAVACRRALIVSNKLDGALHPQSKSEILDNYAQILELLGEPHTHFHIAQALYQVFAELEFHLYPDSTQVLAQLAGCDYRLGIISNTSKSCRSKIQTMVSPWIKAEHIVLSEEEGVHKPCGTIFQTAANRLGVAPSECLYVGDNLHVDALAAVTNGQYASALWVDRKQKRDTEQESVPVGIRRIDSLSEGLGILAVHLQGLSDSMRESERSSMKKQTGNTHHHTAAAPAAEKIYYGTRGDSAPLVRVGSHTEHDSTAHETHHPARLGPHRTVHTRKARGGSHKGRTR